MTEPVMPTDVRRAFEEWYKPETDWKRAFNTSPYEYEQAAFLAGYIAGQAAAQLGPRLPVPPPVKVSPPEIWQVYEKDGFETGAEPFHIDGKYEPGVLPVYYSREAALTGALLRLSQLEKSQPAASSGGQNGIQDRVYIKHPDGHLERITS